MEQQLIDGLSALLEEEIVVFGPGYFEYDEALDAMRKALSHCDERKPHISKSYFKIACNRIKAFLMVRQSEKLETWLAKQGKRNGLATD